MVHNVRLRQFFSFLVFLFTFFFLSFTPTYASETSFQVFQLTPSKPNVDTGMDFNPGDFLTIRAYGTGSAIYVPGMTQQWVSLGGDQGCTASQFYTLPGVPCWSLIARFGIGNPFLVGGNEYNRQVLTKGRLYLSVNHSIPFSGSGSWSVSVIRNFTPPPPPPAPFLELPWDYLGQNQIFSDAAQSINSYFDHEYPLLSVEWVGLIEPVNSSTTILNYENIRGSKPFYFYSSHDGYDWGNSAGTSINTPVLAAADGCAHYHFGLDSIGNAIFIDHPNHYQTRYYHMQPDELITHAPSPCVPVTKGQKIGLVGFSGHTIPENDPAAAHLHFMVIEDKNHDGDFEDNIPDGLTDPFGWQSPDPDPWVSYAFSYNNANRMGNQSYYLWLHPIPNLSQKLPTNGGFYEFQNAKLNFAQNAVKEESKITILSAPLVKVSALLQSVGTSFIISVQNLFGTPITAFDQPFTLNLGFADAQVSRFKPETLSIYSSEDGVNWQAEITNVDWQTKTASASLNHLSQFALVGELKDIEPPKTTVTLDGLLIDGIYYSTVSATLTAADLPNSTDASGISYTAYKLDQSDWHEYSGSITATESGEHMLSFYTVDREDHQEETQTKTFSINIDTAPPQTQLNLVGEAVGPNEFSTSVSAELTAIDTATGSGVLRTLYQLDQNDWGIYQDPFIVKTVGQHILSFYSIDKVQNAEAIQSTTFEITPLPSPSPSPTLTPSSSPMPSPAPILSYPEVKMAIDTSNFFITVGSLSDDPVTKQEQKLADGKVAYSFIDTEDARITVITKPKETRFYKQLAIEQLLYHPTIENSLSGTLTVTGLRDKKGILALGAIWESSEVNITLAYERFSNKTYVFKKQPGKKQQIQTLKGLRLLEIYTNKGAFEYSY